MIWCPRELWAKRTQNHEKNCVQVILIGYNFNVIGGDVAVGYSTVYNTVIWNNKYLPYTYYCTGHYLHNLKQDQYWHTSFSSVYESGLLFGLTQEYPYLIAYMNDSTLYTIQVNTLHWYMVYQNKRWYDLVSMSMNQTNYSLPSGLASKPEQAPPSTRWVTFARSNCMASPALARSLWSSNHNRRDVSRAID